MTNKQINLLSYASSIGVEILNIDDYQNKNNIIKCKCKNGHEIQGTVDEMLKSGFYCIECEAKFQAEIKDTEPYFLSLDAASYNTGMAIFNKEGQLLGSKVYSVNKREDFFKRVKQIVQEIYKICIEQNIKCIILEDTQLQTNPKLYKTLCMLQGVIRYWAINVLQIELITAYPDEWRSYNYIYGAKREEQKLASIQKAKQVFNKDMTDDESDSIFLGIYGIHQFYQNKSYKEE